MTSLHRLIAIILIWLVIALLGAMLPGLALSVSAWVIAVLFIVMLLAATAATWAIARSGGARQ